LFLTPCWSLVGDGHGVFFCPGPHESRGRKKGPFPVVEKALFFLVASYVAESL